MKNFIKSLLVLLFGAMIESIIKVFKKTPEEKKNEQIKNAIDRVGSDDPGYRLPSGTADKWGETITTETRVESSKADGVKRPAGSS